MSLPLTAPSSVRRSKKRCAQYVETNQTVASEMQTDDGWLAAHLWQIGNLCERDVRRDPDYQVVEDFWRYTVDEMRP